MRPRLFGHGNMPALTRTPLPGRAAELIAELKEALGRYLEPAAFL
jgi:hypothetical protein